VSVSDRWHKTRPAPGDVLCREHSRGTTKLYTNSEHLRGDRWLVRWRDASGGQSRRSFPKKSGTDPETCAEAFDAQRRADEARGDWIDPRIGKTPFAEYAPAWTKSRIHKTGTADTYEMHFRNHIIPVFGGYCLAGIRPTMVQQRVKDLQSVKGLTPSTIETIYVIFASTMRGAVRDGYIRNVPPVCPRTRPGLLRRRSEGLEGVSRPVGRVLCARSRGPTVIHLGLALPTASCGLPASIGRAALERSRRPASCGAGPS